jgi:hypothetical protein
MLPFCATEMRSNHQGALPLPLSQPAVSETHAKASGMWDNLLHRRITKLSIIAGPDASVRETTDQTNADLDQHRRSLVHLNSVIQLSDLDNGPWPYRHMAG